MGDYHAQVQTQNNDGQISQTEKQYLEDLEKATRLSIECYENEQKIRKRLGYNVVGPINGSSNNSTNSIVTTAGERLASESVINSGGGSGNSQSINASNIGHNNNSNSSNNNEQNDGFRRRLSQPEALLSDNKSSSSTTSSRQVLDIKPRPRPFARPSSSSASIEGSIISPPVRSSISTITTTTIQPPPTAFRRQRSLPHRHRQSQVSASSSVYTEPIGTSPSNSSAALLLFTNDTKNSTTSCSNNQQPSDDLILLASPKVIPKFDKNNTFLCDTTLYSTPLDDIMSRNSPMDSPIVSSSTTKLSLNNNITTSPIFVNSSLNNSKSTTPEYPQLSLYRFNNNSPGGGGLSPLQQPPFTTISPGSAVIRNVISGLSPSPLQLNNSNLSSIASPQSFLSSSQSPFIRNTSPSAMPPGIGPSPLSQLKAILPSPPAMTNSPALASSSNGSTNKRTSLYQGVFEQLKSITDENEDLIDLGNADSKNILEYFDPLVIREKWKEEQEQRKRKKEQEEAEKQRLKQISKDNESETNKADKIYNDSVLSYGSTATSAFSYRPGSPNNTEGERRSSGSMSLYPSLEEFQNERTDDASSFYDAYNPFEYLYAVSCSTPSANSTYETIGPNQAIYENGGQVLGFSHFYSQHPRPVLPALPPPALPPRNSMDGSVFSGSQPSSRPESPIPSTSKQNDPRITLRHRSVSYDKSKRCGKLYENIEKMNELATRPDSETLAFYEMLRELRLSKRHVDSDSNKGYVKSAKLESSGSMIKNLSLRIIVWSESISESTTFTCDISTSVDMVIEQGIVELGIQGSGRDYSLRIKGSNEYLDANMPLANYQFIRHCIKMDEEVRLVLVARTSLGKYSYARTPRDDGDSVNISIQDILPQIKHRTITEEELKILIATMEGEADRMKEKLSQYSNGNNPTEGEQPGIISSSLFMQSVKAVCFLMGEVVTVEIVRSLDAFVKVCENWNAKARPSSPTTGDKGFEERRRTNVIRDMNREHSFVEIIPSAKEELQRLKESIYSWIDRVIDEVETLLEMFSKSFPVNYSIRSTPIHSKMESSKGKPIMGDMIDEFIIGIGGVHRLKREWIATYTSYTVTAEVYHGSSLTGKTRTYSVEVTKSENHWFFPTLVYDTWLKFFNIPVCILPREAKLVFSLFGTKPKQDSPGGYVMEELGWASIQCFNFKGQLAQGSHLLPLWPAELTNQKRLCPAPNSAFSAEGNFPLLTINFTSYGYEVKYPEIPKAVAVPRDFETLDEHTKELLTDLIDDTRFLRGTPEEKEIFWEKRHYLLQFPNAFPKVLLTAQLWDWASVAQLYALLEKWTPQDPMDALQLLLPCYPDCHVRGLAVKMIKQMPDEEIVNLLPQLVEALCYETYDYSPLAEMLLHKSLCCLEIAHYLFWILASQVGLGKWKDEITYNMIPSSRIPVEGEPTFDPKRRRLELMLNSLIVISGEKWKNALFSQHKMLQSLTEIATQIKQAKDTNRATILAKELEKLNFCIFETSQSFPLPVSPSSLITEIDVKACSYFNSNALPLKLTFKNAFPEGGTISTIFKIGDDLRQDMLTIQAIRLIEKWWIKEGLDLRILTFSCVPTGYRQGMVEMVANAETMCKIQSEHGVTGVFRDSAIAEWLAKMNPSTLDYQRALDNFTLSCAAYCVITYVLGICDRHNDNIMLTKKGHLFHIDFGKFLGDAQMFGNFKRDRSPFVLTSEMVYVINDGEKGSLRFHRFVELCCSAFRVVRRNTSALINLFQLVATAGIPGVDLRSVNYIYTALMPESSNVEAAATFTRLIEMSSQNWFANVNFFIHSLAQLRFSSENIDTTRLSFVPDVYTMESEGRIEKAILVSFEKKYDPVKYYLFAVKLKRKNQPDWSFVHRTYKEFLELHTKIALRFPMARALKPLPRGKGLGRSNVKQVAERRKAYLQAFLESLFSFTDEISHSDLVYTFFHPILRDEQQHLGNRRPSSGGSTQRSSNRIHGQVKLSLVYQRGALMILVHHAVDLASPNNQPPSPYVKMYLQPDNSRVTKRKTRVVRKSQHPTFMENIEYRLPLAIIRQKTLQVSVWHHDSLQENNFLGGVSIKLETFPLEKETTETYTLTNITSKA